MNRPDQQLIKNIEDFIRKYFKNRLFKGLILSILLVSSVFLFLNFIEYFAYLPQWGRMIFFYSFLLLFVGVLVYYVLVPAWKLLGYRKSMSVSEAARLIGQYFPEVNDKLLNTLQLSDDYVLNHKENELLLAAIRQKTEKLSVIPFINAVSNRDSVKYLKYSAIPLSIIVLSLLLFPAFVKNPAQRILLYNTQFSKPLSFEVKMLQSELNVLQNEDFLFQILVTGSEIPELFFLETNGTRVQMNKFNNNEFSHVFKKVGQSVDFRISGGDYLSNSMFLEVFPKPLLLSHEAVISFPSYTKRENETLKDQAYFSVPEGSKVHWKFYTRDTDSLILVVDSIDQTAIREGAYWTYNISASKPAKIRLRPTNRYSNHSEELIITLDVVADEYPTIEINQVEDELMGKKKYFSGLIGDDYGFSKLSVTLSIKMKGSESVRKEVSNTLNIDKDVLRQQFFHYMDLDSTDALPGESVSVQFAIYDNDWINGPKVRYSSVFLYQIASMELLDSLSKSKEDGLNERMEAALKDSKEIQKEITDFARKLMLKKEIDWNDRQNLNKLVEKQQQLDTELEKLKSERETLNNFNKQNKLVDENLLEKQAQIDKLLEEVIPEDIKKMMEELQKLMEELNKDQIAEMLKKMESSSKDIEKMLDRNLSLLKQLQMEKAMNELLSKLDDLSKRLEENAKNTLEKNLEKEKLSDTLKDIQQKFDEEMSKLDSLKKENELLESPLQLEETKSDEQAINKEIEEGQQQLDNKKSKESSGHQKSASEKMKSMRDKLEMMMQMGMDQQMAEDANALRFLLENVLRISLNQEELMQKLSVLRRDDPGYVEIIKNQSIVSESFRVVEDSLVALSKRQPMIENFVFDEIKAVKSRVEEAQTSMKDRVTGNALSSQQFAMMGLNNLALMLSEALKNMQESMGMPSPGQGEGKGKPGKNPGKGLQNMRELQESLGKQLKDAMGENKGQGQGKGMSEEIARMAAQQEAIRQQLKNMIDDLKSEGSMGDGGLNKVLEQMESFEEELINKRLNQELLEMQNEIVIRLLESEKAQKEREQEERRESNEFKGENIGNLRENMEYKKLLERQRETLKVNPIDFHPFYKQKVNQYFIRSNVTIINEKVNRNTQ